MHYKITVYFKSQPMQTHYMQGPEIVIGRSQDCDIHLDNIGVSRQHAKLVVQPDALIVEDLHSGNGTYVNGKKISSAVLGSGDEVRIGKFSIRVAPSQQLPEDSSGLTDAPGEEGRYDVEENTIALTSSDTDKIAGQAKLTPQRQTVAATVRPSAQPVGTTPSWLILTAGAALGLFAGWLLWA